MMRQKISYNSRGEAAEHAKFISNCRRRFSKRLASDHKAGRKMRPYVCPSCGAWHLSTRGRLKYE